MCAGMGGITGADLVAAVSNAGGIGTVGAINLDPQGLREVIADIKSQLKPGPGLNGTMPFGIDLALPQVGGNARATNHDYTNGNLNELVDIMAEEKVDLFVCAVGIPPQWAVDKLHAVGTKVMNMVGRVYHAEKALKLGVDIICAQGTEAGAHTGDVSTLVLTPQVADVCKKAGVVCVAAGGIYDGRGVAASLVLGAHGVWVGTRFLATPEANVTPYYKQQMLESTSNDTRRIEIYTGRPLRVKKDAFNEDWANRREELDKLLAKGIVVAEKSVKDKSGAPYEARLRMRAALGDKKVRTGSWQDIRSVQDPKADFNVAFGQAAGAIHEIKPAAEIVEELMNGLMNSFKQVQSHM